MSVVCDKGKERPLGNIQYCYESAAVQQNNHHSQCILLALCVCARGRGLPEKVLGLAQRRGGVAPPPRFGGGWGSPPPLQPPKLSNTPRGHTLAGASPRGTLSTYWLN